MRDVLDELEDEQWGRVIDSLMARAARGDAGWKPNRRSSRIVNDARLFADAAQQVGHADPDDVNQHLRRASKAFLAGDRASARAVSEAILIPISTVDIDLGQHGLVDDVLSVDAPGGTSSPREKMAIGVPQTPLQWLDLVPKGRDEAALPYAMVWVRHHDRYGEAARG